MFYFYQHTGMTTLLAPDNQLSVLRPGLRPVALITDNCHQKTVSLPCCDFQLSCLSLIQASAVTATCYAPYGHSSSPPAVAFHGEHPDANNGNYLLGTGYRALNPALRRFNSPDNLSPFGHGGINAYAFVSGDPINYSDPSGHVRGLAHLHVPGKTNTRNDPGLTVFTHKRFTGKKTLYVIAHGSGSQAVVGGKKLANSELFNKIHEAVPNLNGYEGFVMNICTSADINPATGTSLGQDFANRFKLKGTAYHGNVKGNLNLTPTPKGVSVDYEVHKKNHLRPGDPGYDNFNYRPAVMTPDVTSQASDLRTSSTRR